MRVVFAGTPEFAAAALAALIDAGFTIPLVLSQPDRPAGRGMKLVASPVKQLALAHGLEVATPPTLSLKKGGPDAEAAHAQLRAVRADVLIVAAYGLILPQAALDIPAGIGPVSRPASICIKVMPVTSSPASSARAIGAAPRQRGSSDAWMLIAVSPRPMPTGMSSTACGRISP